MNLYQSSFHSVKFNDLDLDMNMYYLQRPDNIFFNKLYDRWSIDNYKLLDEKNFLNAKRNAGQILHSIIDKHKILSFGIGTGITESELLKLDSNYDITGIDYSMITNWLDPRIRFLRHIDECVIDNYDCLLLNSVIYSFDNITLSTLISSFYKILKKDSLVIVWEQDLPTLMTYNKIRKFHKYLHCRKQLGFVHWGFIRSPFVIKSKFKKMFKYVTSKYFYVDKNWSNYETRSFYRLNGYKIWQSKDFHANTSQLHIFKKIN